MFLPILLSLGMTLANPILTDFKMKGYCEIQNEKMGAQDFDIAYSQFESLIDFIKNHPEWEQKIYQADQVYLQLDVNKLYGNPPIGFIDEIKSGKSKKVYFHYTKEYHSYLISSHQDLLDESEAFRIFLNTIKKIADLSRYQFEQAINTIQSDIPISEVMHTAEGDLALLIKIVRYEKAEKAASNPHFDFSGLSILLDNTEQEENESLRLSPYREVLSLEDFSPPSRKYRRLDHISSALLIPGLALKYMGLDVDPTPHAVLPQHQTRHATIAFAMVPYVKLTYDQIKLKQINLPNLPKL